MVMRSLKQSEAADGFSGGFPTVGSCGWVVVLLVKFLLANP